jgi:glucosamine--fructose-6-phosphate aminotransferase (isomerizing)
LDGLEKLAGGGEASDDEVNEPNSARIPRKVTLAPSATAPAAVFDLPCKEQTVMERLCNAKRIIVAACGTSWHSGLIAKFTIGIVNGVGSSIARWTDAGVYLHIGPEIGVASTKAVTGQVIAVLMIALKMARQRNTLSVEDVSQHCEALNAVPDLVKDWLEPLNKQIKAIAKYLRLATNVLFCGCGIHFPVALEGALKLKEISHIHAEGFTAAEIKHGPLALVRGFLPVIAVAMRSDPGYDQILANLEELHAKEASLVVITDDGDSDFSNIANFVINCPPTKMIFEPLMVVVPVQLLFYHIADMRGCSFDQPRNLAKND